MYCTFLHRVGDLFTLASPQTLVLPHTTASQHLHCLPEWESFSSIVMCGTTTTYKLRGGPKCLFATRHSSCCLSSGANTVKHLFKSLISSAVVCIFLSYLKEFFKYSGLKPFVSYALQRSFMPPKMSFSLFVFLGCFVLLFWDKVFYIIQLVLNSCQSSCLSLPSVVITGMYHLARWRYFSL